MEKTFSVGDLVMWESQAHGCWRRKYGVVVEVVPAGQHPDRDRFQKLYKGSGIGMTRDHTSYVVECHRDVECQHPTSPQFAQEKRYKTPKVYWPRTKTLFSSSKE